MLLIYFSPMSHFYTPLKRQKTIGCLTFSGGVEMLHWTKIGQLLAVSKLKSFRRKLTKM